MPTLMSQLRPGRALSGGSLTLSAAGVAAVRLLGPFSSFAMIVLMTRQLGAAESGLFLAALALTQGLTVLAKAGLETALQRFIGREAGSEQRQAPVASSYRFAVRLALLLGIAVSLFTLLLSGSISIHLLGDARLQPLVALLSLTIAPMSLLGINAATLKALSRPAWGTLFEAGAWPALTLIANGALLLLGYDSPVHLASGFLAAALAAALFSQWLTLRHLPRSLDGRRQASHALLRSCFPLLTIEAINYALLWLPLLTLPALSSAEQAGLYATAHRVAAQLGLIMLVLAAITSPQFASHYHHGRLPQLESLAGQTTRLLLAFALVPAMVLLLWPASIMALFGDEFAPGGAALSILVFGQLFHLATGPTGHLLAMTGHEKELRNNLLLSLVGLLLLTLLLVPAYGAIGAAIAVTGAQILHKLFCSLLVVRHLRLPFLLAFAR